MRKHQRGYLFESHGAWYVQWYDAEKKRQSKRLASKEEYPRRVEVRPLADAAMKEANASARNGVPGSGVSVKDFVTCVFLPHIKEYKRRSTHDSYRDLAKTLMLLPQAKKRIRDTRTPDIQAWIKGYCVNRGLSVTTAKHVKAFLSGIFRYAITLGICEINPVHASMIPQGLKEAEETKAYSLEETETMLRCVSDLEIRAMIGVAAFAGLRRGEISGLRWEDASDTEIKVERSRVCGVLDKTKSKASKASIPLIPRLARLLEEYRLFLGNPTTGPMFVRTEIGNIGTAHIRPKLVGVVWSGWHGFRRGLGTRLHSAGVSDIKIQRILRHASVVTTREHYIKHIDKDVIAAMAALDTAETRIQ